MHPWVAAGAYRLRFPVRLTERLAIRDIQLLPIRFECVVEGDGALRSTPIERQSEEELLWHSLKHKPRHTLEPEFLVVIRMSNKATSLGIHILQPRKESSPGFVDTRFIVPAVQTSQATRSSAMSGF